MRDEDDGDYNQMEFDDNQQEEQKDYYSSEDDEEEAKADVQQSSLIHLGNRNDKL